MFCPNCGNLITDEMKFCGNCGTKINAETKDNIAFCGTEINNEMNLEINSENQNNFVLERSTNRKRTARKTSINRTFGN